MSYSSSTLLSHLSGSNRTSYYKIDYTFGSLQPFHWKFVAGNGEILAFSEMLSSHAACVNAIQLMKASGNAAVVDEDQPLQRYLLTRGEAYYAYRKVNSEYRFRFYGANHEIVASGEGYTALHNVHHAIDILKNSKNDPVK